MRSSHIDNQQRLLDGFLSAPLAPFTPMSLIYRRSVFERIGCFDEKVGRNEDVEFIIRLLMHCSVGYVSEAVYNYFVATHSTLQRLKNRLSTISGKFTTI